MSKMFRKILLLALVCSTSVYAQKKKWYEEMEFGPAWSNTFSDTYLGEERTAALKGILVDLGEHKSHALFDTETLRWVAAYDGFIQWGGTPWTGDHGKLAKLTDDKPIFVTSSMPGWADQDGSFEDKRKIKEHGDIPNGKFVSYTTVNQKVIFAYDVLGTRVEEICIKNQQSIQRSIFFSLKQNSLTVLLCEEKGEWKLNDNEAVASTGLHVKSNGAMKWKVDGGKLFAQTIAKEGNVSAHFSFKRDSSPDNPISISLSDILKESKPQYPEIIETVGTEGEAAEGSSWATDTMELPKENPWHSNMRFSAFDFLDDDRAAISTWNGDLWIVSGLTKTFPKLKWQRVLSGLFEPLGLKVVNGEIYVNGRDQISKISQSGGAVKVETFNRDAIVSKNFHEFSFDLQTDSKGNFYVAKAAPVKGGGRGFDEIFPNHGTVMKISADGKKMEVIASGLRCPGGIGVGPNDEITTGENEGTWQPCCKLNYIKQENIPAFLGTENSRHDVKGDMLEPILYFPMTVDNSGGDQVWVPKDVNWGLKSGELIHLSYGQSSLYRVMKNSVVKIPVTLSSSAMRARFHKDGSLFVLGFRGWQTNASSECAFQRIRYVKKNPVLIPENVTHESDGVTIQFAEKLDEELANDPTSYNVERWNYVRGPQYGSGEFSVDHPDVEKEKLALTQETHAHKVHDSVKVLSAKVLEDGKSIKLVLEGMKPCMTLKIAYDLEDKNGDIMKGEIYGTVKK